MARPKKTPRVTSVRLTEECAKWSKIVAGFRGESITDYINRRFAPIAEADARELAGSLNQPPATPEPVEPEPAPKGKVRGKKGGG